MAQRNASTSVPAVVPFTPNVENPMLGGSVFATPDPNPPSSLAQVMGATRGPVGQGSAATVQYGGPQISATPEQGQEGGWRGVLRSLSNVLGPLPTKPTQSQAVVKDSGTGGAGAIGSVADPQLANSTSENALALQMFFTQAIAPYLDSIRASMGQNADLTKAAYGQVAPHLSPQLQPFFNADQKSAQVRTLADALAASTAAGPSLDQLMSQISAAQDAQRYAAYQSMKAQSGQAAGGLIGALLGAGGEDDALAGLLGGDLASEAKKKS